MLEWHKQSKSGVVDFLCSSRKVRKIKGFFLPGSRARRPSIKKFDCGSPKTKAMPPPANNVRRWKGFFLLTVVLLLVGCTRWSANSSPSITFNTVPAADARDYNKLDNVEGRAKNFRSGQQIALYTQSEELWWIQPGIERPFTNIGDGGEWKGQVHPGTQYAAMLVDPGYSPPETFELLPPIGNGIAAITVTGSQGRTTAPKPTKTLHFSGYDWIARTVASNRAGTRNSFDPANAWTDELGALHLRIAKSQGKWTCAEVKLTRSLGYGTYIFVVGDTSQFEPSVILTLLTWDGLGTERNRRELDVEISRWGYRENENAHYVVQPYFIPANMVRFRVPGGVLTHSFKWEPSQVTFSTTAGSQDAGG